MSAITGRLDALLKLAAGKGVLINLQAVTPASGTAAVAASGFFSMQPTGGGQTAYPSSIVPFQTSAPANPLNTLMAFGSPNNTTLAHTLGIFYTLGTVNLASPGDQFTADVNFTGPLLRTQYGKASQPIVMDAILYITTLTATTAAIVTLKTAGGAAGYTNQDGVGVVGTRTITLPAAATAAQSGFSMRLELGDCGVQGISAVQVNTAASAGAARIYGFEPRLIIPGQLSRPNFIDDLNALLGSVDLTPAVATTGTVPSFLGILNNGSSGRFFSGMGLAVSNG